MNGRKAKEARLAELKARLLTVEGTPTEVYSRIVGYYRSVRNWNAGKRDEFGRRREYAFPVSASLAGRPNDGRSIAGRSIAGRSIAGRNNADDRADAASVPGGSVASFTLFTRKTCPNCPPVRDYLEASGLPGRMIDVDTPEGMDLAIRYGVMATPTAILGDRNGSELTRAYTRAQLLAALAPVARTVAVTQTAAV